MMSASLIDHFSPLEDPRIERNKRHALLDILVLVVSAVCSNAKGWEAIEDFGHAKLDWLRQYVPLVNGVPSHDCIEYVMTRLSPVKFRECFINWTQAVKRDVQEVIAVDGKTARGSRDRANGGKPLHMVTAWACENRLVLAQEATDEKSNEITAIPKLLMQLNMAGAVVTLDAMGCQTAIAQQIVDKDADYLFSLKGNQSTLHQDVKLFFESANTCPPVGYISYDGGHGRIETRSVRATSAIDWLKKDHSHLPKLTSIIAVTATRECKDKTTEETRYFITSMDASNPERLGQYAASITLSGRRQLSCPVSCRGKWVSFASCSWQIVGGNSPLGIPKWWHGGRADQWRRRSSCCPQISAPIR